MTDPTPPTPPTPPESHWGGIRREGSTTGMPRFPWSGITRTVTGRRLLIQAGIIFGMTLAGYLVAAFWLYPAPLFSTAIAIPRVLELDAATAEQRLVAAGLRVKRDDEIPHPHIPRGNVAWQEPAPYSELGPGGTVTILVSSGPPELGVPDVEGVESSLAQKIIAAAGITIKSVDSVANSAPKGTALATRPAAGTTVEPDQPIELVVSSGPATASIPDVSGLTIPQAREKLNRAGFAIGKITKERAEGVPEGQVVRQRPAAGGLASLDGRIDIVVAGEPE